MQTHFEQGKKLSRYSYGGSVDDSSSRPFVNLFAYIYDVFESRPIHSFPWKQNAYHVYMHIAQCVTYIIYARDKTIRLLYAWSQAHIQGGDLRGLALTSDIFSNLPIKFNLYTAKMCSSNILFFIEKLKYYKFIYFYYNYQLLLIVFISSSSSLPLKGQKQQIKQKFQYYDCTTF